MIFALSLLRFCAIPSGIRVAEIESMLSQSGFNNVGCITWQKEVALNEILSNERIAIEPDRCCPELQLVRLASPREA